MSPASSADPSQPQTTLQVPGPAVVDVVQNVWQFTKRKANITWWWTPAAAWKATSWPRLRRRCASSSTRSRARRASQAGRIQYLRQQHRPVGHHGQLNRAHLERSIDNLEAGGDTALLDAIMVAYDRISKTRTLSGSTPSWP
ncbi:MAG: hypothetical protein R2844_03825 [Caldilineales bacterium]